MDLSDTLVEMGFPRNRAEKALQQTGHRSVENAMDWLLNHPEDDSIEESSTSNSALENKQELTSEQGSPTEVARSMKCDDCGKPLRTENEMQVHAARTGHVNFSESTEEVKPLTAEQKAEQLAKLQEKIKLNRMAREEKEKAEAIDREKIRRAQGKDISTLKFEMEQKEIRQLAEQKRREKMEEKIAKQKVLEQIKMDREAKLASSHTPAPTVVEPVKQEIPSQKAEAKEYTECRLQMRLPTGQPIVNTFKANETLAAVRLFIQMKGGFHHGELIKLQTNLPRRVFTEDDMEAPLSALGLVPSAVLIVTKQ